MSPARPPVAAATLRGPRHVPMGPLRLFRCVPQPSAREPFQQNVRIGALQLPERREQIVALPRAECRGAMIDQDGPIGITRRHGVLRVARRYALQTPAETLDVATFEFFDERRPLETEERGRLALVAVGALERLLNQLPLDARH